MKNYIPPIEDRIDLVHNGGFSGSAKGLEQTQKQNEAIIEFARQIQKARGLPRLVSVEVWYKRTDVDVQTTEKDFDAVVVDTVSGNIIDVLDPYDSIDPDWRSKRV